jgi:4-amino-4-deoxy-L-arabinose transferase-like glycosyltransferase
VGAVSAQLSAPTGRRSAWRRIIALSPALAILAAAAGLRLFHIATAYDLHIDEVTYTTVADSVAGGGGVALHGAPFFLHPPMLFWILGGLVRMLGRPELLSDEILSYRPLSVAFSVITCAALIAIVGHATTRRTGLLAGALFAVDAFAIRFDSRLFLEAPAMTFTALAYLTLVLGARRPASGRAWAIAAGVLFGCAMLTKDTVLLVFAPALLVALVAGRALPRPAAALALLTSGAVYLVYLAGLLVSGDLGAWLHQKTGGFRRLAGADQLTGFNNPDSPPLSARLAANLEQFSVSYLVIVCGTAAALYVVCRLWRGGRPRADACLLLGLWQLSAVGFLAYAMLFGTLEEQMFYFVLVPSIPALCVAATLLASEPREARRISPRVVRPVLDGATVMVLVLSLAAWHRVHTMRSDNYAQAVAYVERDLPKGTTIAVTEGIGQFLLPDVRLGEWTTPDDLRRQGVDYVLVNSRLVDQGYGVATPTLARWLARNATVARVFGPSPESLLVLHRLNRAGTTPRVANRRD